MRMSDLCIVLLCFMLIRADLPPFMSIPIDTLLGLYTTVWLCTWGIARFGEVGALVGAGFFVLFVGSRLVAYGLIEPAL